MYLSINNNNIPPNTWKSLSDLGALSISWDADPEKYYTLIIYDHDASFLHALYTNIPGNLIEYANVLTQYIPPNPPIGSGQHRYSIALYSQRTKISSYNIQRTNFDLEGFINRSGLTLVENEILVADPTTREYYRVAEETSEPSVTVNSEHPLIIANSTLSNSEQKYCSCVVEAAEKQPGACNLEKAWFEERDGRICANPFAICAKSTGGSNRECPKNYNYDNFTDIQLTSLANLYGITVSDRNTMVSMFRAK